MLLTRSAQRHLAWLAAAFLVLLAVGAWLDIPRALTTPAGIVHGVSYTDVAARFPVARALAGVSLLGAVLAVVAAYGRMTPLFIAIGLYLLVSLGGGAYASADPAVRRRAERAGARDAVHRSTTSPRRGRPSGSTASKSAS